MNSNRPSSTQPIAPLRELLQESVASMAQGPARDLPERITRRIAEKRIRFVIRRSRVSPRRRVFIFAATACVLLALEAIALWCATHRAASKVGQARPEVSTILDAARVRRL
jgi:hypothetical protein